MPRPMLYFAVAAMVPPVLIGLGLLFGGGWAYGALIYLTALTFLLDQMVVAPDDKNLPQVALPAADRLLVLLAAVHFGLLGLAVWALSGRADLTPASWISLFLALGMFFGQVSNANAHELIHRSNKALFSLGKWMYISLLFGHHTSAHRHIHHRYVATPDDPNSAPKGESYYTFAPRAWIGSFRAGWEIETALRKRADRRSHPLSHPYTGYLLGGAGFCMASVGIGGFNGFLVFVGLAFYAQAQLLLSDYVQHYGLRRMRSQDGKLEPVAARHSWNAPHWFSSKLMLNAPRHSDHHAHPTRPYPALQLPPADEAPMLPLGLPAMATLALFPRRWRRVMDKRLKHWEGTVPNSELAKSPAF